MAEHSAIEWCDSTFNPWEGCQKVGPGCDHCYAENRNARFGGGVAVNWGPGAPRRRTSSANWAKPLLWEREHEAFMLAHGRRRRVFCASLADVFDNEVPWQWRLDLFGLIRDTPHLDWLLLTKRIGNVPSMLTEIQVHGSLRDVFQNVWIGATVVNQAEADRDIPKLLGVPARVRFLSIEPMLGPIKLDQRLIAPIEGTSQHGQRFIDWIIAGGESGPHARPAHPDWFRGLRDQCAAAGVPFLFKQWGEWIGAGQAACPSGPPASRWQWGDGAPFVYGEKGRSLPLLCRAGKKLTGRLLDGVEHNGFPC